MRYLSSLIVFLCFKTEALYNIIISYWLLGAHNLFPLPLLFWLSFYIRMYSQEGGIVFPFPANFFLESSEYCHCRIYSSSCFCLRFFPVACVFIYVAIDSNHSTENHSCYFITEEIFSPCTAHFSQLYTVFKWKL